MGLGLNTESTVPIGGWMSGVGIGNADAIENFAAVPWVCLERGLRYCLGCCWWIRDVRLGYCCPSDSRD